LFLDGRWEESESGRTFDATSPATGEVIATVAEGTRKDASRAVEAAHRARDAMRSLGAFDRARLLHAVADAIERRREELARVLTLDQGKPYAAEALGEVSEAAEYFRIAAEDGKRLEGSVLPSVSAGKWVFTRRVPRGVYAVITPWNWPLTMAAELVAPALAGGNTVVWAPAPSTAAVSVKLMECLAEADLPSGAVNLVTGPGPVVGDEIAGHPLVGGVGFIGSTVTGASVARRAAGKHVMLELGGNGPIIVFADADLERAVEGTITGCYLCAGQSCTAGERILVEERVRDDFVALLDAAVARLRLGDPFEPETTLGPLNNEGVAQKMDEHVSDAVERGARVVAGGVRAAGFPTDLYYEATILSGVSPDMRVSREETFGPVAPVIAFRDEAEALALANDSPYGLLGAVYTRDLSRALRFVDRLDAGWVNVNESSNYWEPHLPFGGGPGKQSGLGRVGGRFALEQMTDLKTAVIEVEGMRLPPLPRPSPSRGEGERG
jgi:succinate-semialdehyde dehydrogenase/glutarate-semialdehyde dehydrogenase